MPTAVTKDKSRHGIYDLGDGTILFVPCEEMWALHEASKPAAICIRAGLSSQYFYQLIKRLGESHPWLVDFLYTPRCLPPTSAKEFKITEEMQAFRREASIESILAATPRAKDKVDAAWRSDRRETVTDSLLSHWRRVELAGHDWYDPWLLRGEDPPSHVHIAPIQLVRHCSVAWNIQVIRECAEISSETYCRWLKLRLITSLNWLKWLFGAPPPAGSFVVGIVLQALRREMGQEAIIDHLGLSKTARWTWENSELTQAAIQAVLVGRNPVGVNGWDRLTNRSKRNLLDYKKAASLPECLERAGMSKAAYYKARREAEACGVLDQLDRYLRMEDPYHDKPRSGLVAPDFFIPTPDMLKFREAAIEQGAGQNVWGNQLPGFDDWFLDWALPKSHRGQRLTLPRRASMSDTEAASRLVGEKPPLVNAVSVVNGLTVKAQRLPSQTDRLEPDARPATPTVGYCLRPPNLVRWDGETELPPRLYHLLQRLLEQSKWPVPFDVAEDILNDIDNAKKVGNAISLLNSRLEPIHFPWEFGTKSCNFTKR
jgi:hypothetical protein